MSVLAGLSLPTFVLGHAMRSALTPVVSQLGIDDGTLLGGVVVVETVLVIVANILTDIAYALLDPRVRLT